MASKSLRGERKEGGSTLFSPTGTIILFNSPFVPSLAVSASDPFYLLSFLPTRHSLTLDSLKNFWFSEGSIRDMKLLISEIN